MDILLPGEFDEDDNTLHIYPVNDLREHIFTRSCWCNPRIEHDGVGHVCIHNSMDGREKYETGERKLN